MSQLQKAIQKRRAEWAVDPLLVAQKVIARIRKCIADWDGGGTAPWRLNIKSPDVLYQQMYRVYNALDPARSIGNFELRLAEMDPSIKVTQHDGEFPLYAVTWKVDA
jgi:hypothetical protein